MAEASFVENLLGVGEHLHGTALIGRDRNGVSILLDGRACDLVGPAVVPEMDDLAALALQDPAKDPYGHIVTIEDGRSSNDSQRHATARGTGGITRNAILSTANHANSDPAGPQECAAH